MPRWINETVRKAENNIAALLEADDVDGALDAARGFFARFRQAVLSEPLQYGLVGEFLARELFDAALTALSRYLEHYPHGPHAHELRLQHAFLLSRYVKDYAAAEKILRGIMSTDFEPKRRRAAEAELRRVGGLLARVSSPEVIVESTCAVIRQTDAPFDLPRAGRIVAAATGETFADVTRSLRSSVGMVARGLSPEVATRLAKQLQADGIPVLVVPEDKLVGLPAVRHATCGLATPEKVRFALEGRGIAERKWKDVHLVTCGRVRSSVPTTPAISEPEIPVFIGLYPVSLRRTSALSGLKSRPKETEAIVVDFFLLEPYERVRIRDDAYSPPGSSAGAGAIWMNRFREFATAVVNNSGPTPVDKSLYALVEAGRGRKVRSFGSLLEFAAYSEWLLQLHEFS